MANSHFFQPFLPGFHAHLTIPVAFFSKHIKGRNDHNNTAKLRSDPSEMTWKVKIEDDGLRLTDGWKEFALAHNLRIGDIVIFRQEKDMAFHVTLFGPSCCEIQYRSCIDQDNNLEKIPKKKNPKREEAESSCFVAKVTPSNLRYDKLYLPRSFVRANGLKTRCGEIVLVNETGRSWTLKLKRERSRESMYIRPGWRSFCRVNGLRAGSFFTLRLIRRGGTLTLCLSPKETEDCSSEANETESLSTESESDEGSSHISSHERIEREDKKCGTIWEASSSTSQSRFVTLTVKPLDFKNSRLYLPMAFTKNSGINAKTKLALLDKNGVKWSTDLRFEYNGKRIRMIGGWKKFFKANFLKIGESIMFELIWDGNTSCVLKICSEVDS
ncbi:hypothetical protein Bca52824_027989 [Brassica carinata]|uniref:TF-B3 domain-containing protein n=1 Tax=Brassica carinata TaxID=52824 RepID=A0A8X7VBM1_BRACI|nr:hypothetical protein Bca52824_027989 [Brassica carinata]